MSSVPGLADPYLNALVLGFTFGAVVCTSSCLPYIASYIAGTNAGFKKGVLATLIFNVGRIAAYTLIGAAVGIFKLVASDPLLTSFQGSFQMYSGPAFGAVSIATGAYLLLKSRSSNNCNKETIRSVNGKKFLGRFDFGAFTLGFSRGLIVCGPLMLILATSIPFASPIDSVALALLFGIGTSLSPILLFGGATGWLLSKAPDLRKWISIGGAAILIILGAITLFSAIII